MSQDKQVNNTKKINTGGGPSIGNDVNTNGGDVVGRDKPTTTNNTTYHQGDLNALTIKAIVLSTALIQIFLILTIGHLLQSLHLIKFEILTPTYVAPTNIPLPLPVPLPQLPTPTMTALPPIPLPGLPTPTNTALPPVPLPQPSTPTIADFVLLEMTVTALDVHFPSTPQPPIPERIVSVNVPEFCYTEFGMDAEPVKTLEYIALPDTGWACDNPAKGFYQLTQKNLNKACREQTENDYAFAMAENGDSSWSWACFVYAK